MSADYTVGVPTLPEHSTRYRFWIRLQHWFGEHLAWVPPSWHCGVTLYPDTDTSWPGPAVSLHARKCLTPEDFAGGVARFWEDAPTVAEVQAGDGYRCLRLRWTTPGPDAVEVTVFGPDCADLAPYREALVAAGVLRAEPVEDHCETCGEEVEESCPDHPKAPVVSIASRVTS